MNIGRSGEPGIRPSTGPPGLPTSERIQPLYCPDTVAVSGFRLVTVVTPVPLPPSRGNAELGWQRKNVPPLRQGTNHVTTTTVRASDLEPSLVGAQTYVTRRRPTYIDAGVLLSVMFVLLALIPARFIIPGMTDLGRPALVVGFLLFIWWLVARFGPNLVMPGPQPIRWAFFVFFIVLVLGYAVGFLRGLTSMESNAADRTMLFFCVFGGAALTAADGLPNWNRLTSLLKVLVVSATFVAAFGVIEYLLKRDLSDYLTIPGLQAKGWTPILEDRGAAVRVASTTDHCIEMAAYLALVLPFAVHFAVFAKRRRGLAITAAIIIMAGIASTVSRTGIIALAIMLLTLAPLWTWRMRYNIGFVVTILVGAGAGASPRL